MNHITTLPNTGRIAAASVLVCGLVFGLTGAGAQTPHALDHSREDKPCQ
jgi:hypothetical protein